VCKVGQAISNFGNQINIFINHFLSFLKLKAGIDNCVFDRHTLLSTKLAVQKYVWVFMQILLFSPIFQLVFVSYMHHQFDHLFF
jgi:hypothetical protein